MDQCIEIKPGIVVLFNAEKYEVLRSLSKSSVLARNLHTQVTQKLYNDKIEEVINCAIKYHQKGKWIW
jgi:hypothetical protein